MSKHRRRKRYGDPPRRTLVRGYHGPPCPQCGYATQVCEHDRIRRRHLRQRRWYCCVNHHCATTLIMPEEHKVWNRVPGLLCRQGQRASRKDNIGACYIAGSVRPAPNNGPRSLVYAEVRCRHCV
jgi:hypothetical protein